MSSGSTHKRPLAAEEDGLDATDHPATKVARTSGSDTGGGEPLFDSDPSDVQSEDSSSDDDVQEIPALAPAQPKPKRKRRARPQATEPLTVEEQYAETLKSIDKTWDAMVKKFWKGVTSDDTAHAMSLFLPLTNGMAAVSPTHAFNLLLDLGEHSYGDILQNDFASGHGGTTGHVYRHMDSLMLELIRLRLERDKNPAAPAGGDDFTIEPNTYAQDAGGKVAAYNIELGGRYGKKNQKKKRDRLRADDLRTLCETRRRRREEARDWMGNALGDLVETRKRIDRCGLGDHYFRLSIQKLCELRGGAAVPAEHATRFDEQLTFLVPYRPVAEDYPYARPPWLPRGLGLALSEDELRRPLWAEELREANAALLAA